MKRGKLLLTLAMSVSLLAGSIPVYAADALPAEVSVTESETEAAAETGVISEAEPEIELTESETEIVVDETEAEVEVEAEVLEETEGSESEEVALQATTGTCGSRASWSYANGVLTISGSGVIEGSASELWPSYMNTITDVVIQSGITEIDPFVFSGMTALKNLSLPETMTSIGSSAFQGCSSLASVNLPANLTWLGLGAFGACTSLKSITIPAKLDSLADFTFSGCSALETVIIEEGFTGLTNMCFSNCKALTNIVIPESVNYIEDNVFDGHSYRLTVNCVKNSVAYDFAVAKGIKYQTTIKAPGMVSGLRAQTSGFSAVKLSWSYSGTIRPDGYLIYGKNGSNGPYHYIGSSATTSFTDTKALNDEYNFYWVMAFVRNDEGKVVPGAAPKYVYGKGLTLGKTSNVRAAGRTNGVCIAWSAATGAQGYLIYGIRPGEKYGYIGMTSGTSYIDAKASMVDYTYYWVFPYIKGSDGSMMTGAAEKYVYGKTVMQNPSVSARITTLSSTKTIRTISVYVTNNGKVPLTIGGMGGYQMYTNGPSHTGSVWSSYHVYRDNLFGAAAIKEMEGEKITIPAGKSATIYLALKDTTYMADTAHLWTLMNYGGVGYMAMIYKNGQSVYIKN